MSQCETIVHTEEQVVVKKPSKYQVIIHNDEVTTFNYVIQILQTVFNKDYDQAYEITMNVHEQGRGIGGVYVKDVAVNKKHECENINTLNSMHLKVSVEEN